MNMLTRRRTPGSFNVELSTQPFEDLVKSVFNCFPGLRPEMIFSSNMPSPLEYVVKDKTVEVKFPCPGRCKDDFEVEVVGDFLTVKAMRCCHKEEKNDKKHYVIRERTCESCEESIKLPVPVKGAETKAKYCCGVLELSIPRVEEEKNKPHIVKVN